VQIYAGISLQPNFYSFVSVKTLLMNRKLISTFLSIFIIPVLITSCKSKIKETEDSVYSRHLQRHVKLSIINTPAPDDRNNYNLVLINADKDVDRLNVKEIVDSLYKKKAIQPLVLVKILSEKPADEFGISGTGDEAGKEAEKYAAFIDDELYPFVKKKSGVRKFNSVSITGYGKGGTSAFDNGWENSDKIDKAGIFSGTFDVTGAASDAHNGETRVVINKILSSRKRPHTQFWFYYGGNDDNLKNTKDLVDLLGTKGVSSGDIVFINEKQGTNDFQAWRHQFPEFLIWAVGK